MFTFTTIAQILWTSFATSSAFVLFAVAFALVLKVNRVFNFSQAGAMTISFYAAYVVVQWLGLPAWIGFFAAIAAAVGFNILAERLGFAALRRRRATPMFVFIFTLIVSEFVSYLASLVFGTWPQTIFASIFWPVTLVSSVAVSAWDIRAVLATLAAIVALAAFLRWSRWGQYMIAVADNADLAELYGIAKDRVFLLTMVVAGALTGLGMFLYGTRAQVSPAASIELILFAVVATIIGGIGNVFGAGLAALCLALIQNGSVLFIPSEWQGFLLYAFLFLAIVFFPSGIRVPRSVALPRFVLRRLGAARPGG